MPFIYQGGTVLQNPSLAPGGTERGLFDVLPQIGETAIRIIQAVRGEQIEPIPFQIGLDPAIQAQVGNTLRISTTILLIGGIVLLVAFMGRGGR